jgi:hypothetical protein
MIKEIIADPLINMSSSCVLESKIVTENSYLDFLIEMFAVSLLKFMIVNKMKKLEPQNY